MSLFHVLLRTPEIHGFFAFFLSLFFAFLSWNSPSLPSFLFTHPNVYAVVALYITATVAVIRIIAEAKVYSPPPHSYDGKLVVITGASFGGIGFETASSIMKSGGKVIIGVRGENRAKKTAQDLNDICQYGNNSPLRCVGFHLDLSHFGTIKEFSDQVIQFCNSNPPYDRIDLLINNAGVMACPFTLTSDGLENQTGTNHFGHFYLTQLLIPKMITNKTSNSPSLPRVVNVSSIASWFSSRKFDYPSVTSAFTYDKNYAYGLSKLMNIYFTQQLQNKYKGKILVACCHPGAIFTNLMRYSPGVSSWISKGFMWLFLRSPQSGASTTLWCATRGDIVGGSYYQNCHFANDEMPSIANNVEYSQHLWELSERTVKEKTGKSKY